MDDDTRASRSEFEAAAPQTMSRTRALLLTDVVDSTQLAEQLGDAAAAELNAAHDRAARDLLRSWRGREIDKTDGMLMLFEQAADALGFAMAYHAALAALPVPLQARAGLHVGPVILRTNSPEDVAHGAKLLEVEGIAKPVTARVMSLALGGQTLLTAEARAALGTTALRVQSHGFWRIKGIAEPVELFEAGDERAPFMPPPDSAKVYRVVRRDDLWLPLRDLRKNLPVERDSFVGRRDALDTLARRLDGGARLVSLLGIGGTGKTRLALRFAWTWLGDYAGGAWFCDLSQARDVDGIVQAVAQSLDVPLGKDDPVQQLGHAIAGRGHCLLILDNFEQVARHASDTLGQWLDRAADARFLVTTREVLGLPGEEAVPLAPMGLLDAQALFARRAASASAEYLPSNEDIAAIPQLIKLLDGLPLAIELAAARVRVMPPRTLLSRMDQRFTVLSAQGGRRDRQATLRATFDWSWDLLNDAEKSTLAQLSVFEGGFTLEAAEAVVDLSLACNAPKVFHVLHSLVDKSFVQRVGDARFDLLVSVQEYAAEQVAIAQRFPGSGPGAVGAIAARHAAYFGRQDERDAAQMSSELQNFIVACRRIERLGDVDLAATLLERAWARLQQQGPYHVAADLALKLLAMPGMNGRTCARVHWVTGSALQHGGKNAAAYEHLEAAVELFDRCGDQLGRARALRLVADLDMHAGRLEQARDHASLSLAIAHQLSVADVEIDALTSLGNILERRGQADEAHRSFERAIARAREIGDRRREGKALGNLSLLCGDQGSMDAALVHQEAALVAADEAEDHGLQCTALCNLGLLHQLMGDSGMAQARLEQALDVARRIGNAFAEGAVLCNLGIVLEATSEVEAARERYEAALVLARVLRDEYLEGQFLGYLGLLHARQLRHAEARRCLERGQALLEASKDRVGLAVLICSRAEAEELAGNMGAARTAHLAASDIAASIGSGPDSELGLALAKVADRLDRE